MSNKISLQIKEKNRNLNIYIENIHKVLLDAKSKEAIKPNRTNLPKI